MTKPKLKPTAAIGTPEQQAQLAALYELEKHEDAFHALNGTKRTTPRLSEIVLRQIEDGPETAEIHSRLAERWQQVEPTRWRFWLRRVRCCARASFSPAIPSFASKPTLRSKKCLPSCRSVKPCR